MKSARLHPLVPFQLVAVLTVLSLHPARAELDDPGRNSTDAGTVAAVPPEPVNVPEEEPPLSPEEENLRIQVAALIPPGRHYTDLAAKVVAKAYQERGFRPFWSESASQSGFHRALAEELKRHGFPELLAIDPDALVSGISDSPVEKRDLAHTVAFCDAALLIRLGAVAPARIWPDWDLGDTPGSDERSMSSVLGDLVVATALTPFEMTEAIKILGPKNWIYRELLKTYLPAREAMLQYSGLPQIPDPEQTGPGRPGEGFAAAPALAAHLADRGYLNLSPDQIPLLNMMTPELTGALVRFQLDYGLDADGVFGPDSWRYLNTNAADRYRSITINLHRARLMPGNPGDRYLIANVPCAELYLFNENDFHVKTMRIVHGKADIDSQRTRIFRDRMQEVVFGPYWNVPPSIAVKDLIPKEQDEWGYLGRNNYEIVNTFSPENGAFPISPETLQGVAQGRLLLRQKPGPENALGYVKFLFPNSFNIYMHDTPWKDYFLRSNRDHSHGCIRVSKPDELAEWILEPGGWSLDRARAAMQNELNKSVSVKGGLNVYITYFTTFPRPSPGGKFLLVPGRDVYGFDAVDSRTLSDVVPWSE